jgi:hypothetical protein
MASRVPVSQLVVEGKNDQHVIWALCERHAVPKTFTVVTPDDETGGVGELLDGIPVRLKIAGLRILGLVIDADQNLQGRWDAVSHRLEISGYQNLPDRPDPQGTILEQERLPRVGIWLMPDNQLPGMLEDFVAHLIPQNDLLLPKAEFILTEIERENLHRYPLLHHPKALIHTWLAWQELPGRPMGQSITAQVLSPNNPIAIAFVEWLNRLFA